MKKNIFYEPPKNSLVSEVLRGVLPSEENEEKDKEKFFSSSIITAAMIVDPEEDSLLGQLVGIEIPKDIGKELKIDVRVEIRYAYKFLTEACVTGKEVQSIITGFEDMASRIPGPFKITNAKILEIDVDKKTCVFGIDLFNTRETP